MSVDVAESLIQTMCLALAYAYTEMGKDAFRRGRKGGFIFWIAAFELVFFAFLFANH